MSESRPPLTFVSDLRPSHVVTIEGTIAALEATREVATRNGSKRRVRNAKLKDRTGEITLVLWEDDVDRVALGDRVRIQEGWVSDYRGLPQLSLGRTGRLEKLDAEPPAPGSP